MVTSEVDIYIIDVWTSVRGLQALKHKGEGGAQKENGRK